MADRVSFEESVRRWSTTCSLCGQPCAAGEAKELAVGHVMHWGCYDNWLKAQDKFALGEAKPRSPEMSAAVRGRVLDLRPGRE